MDDIKFISTKPRVGGQVIIDDWHTLLRLENHKWIHSFEGFDEGEWIAPLTSRGKEIIQLYEKYELKENESVDEFFNKEKAIH
jgi:molybdenum-dependent DNA-binding transcriptional regulator ModE